MAAQFLSDQVNDGASLRLGERNLILRAGARCHQVRDFPGPLSIKTVTRGRACWRHEGRNLTLGPDSFLVLADGQPYSLDIHAREPVHTCIVFFAKGFVESICSSLGGSDLDGGNSIRLDFLSHIHPRDERVMGRIVRIGHSKTPDRLWLEQQFVDLGQDLLGLYREVIHRIRMLPARKAGTREELYRRVSRGRDYIHAKAFERISLDETARAACLSPFHFHRAFRSAFGVSVHQYVTRLRVQRAAQLLRAVPEVSVTEIVGAVGFESATSFASLFRRYTGASPSVFRRRSEPTADDSGRRVQGILALKGVTAQSIHS